MSTPSKHLRFLYDYLSPYAYLAWHRIHGLAAEHGWAVEPVPVLLAGLLDHNGHLGPAEIPSKRRYVFKDTLRTARVLGLPLVPPATHPFNPLLALRVSGLDLEPAAQRALIDGLWRVCWGGEAVAAGRDLANPQVVAQVASAAGLDGEQIVEQAGLPHNKGRLRAHTDAAISAGVFGVPTVLAAGELFWGLDSFAHLGRHLSGEVVVTDADAAAWNDLPVGVTRKR